MRRRGFTLLETVIALSIAMVVMGAAISANRVIQRNSQQAELATQQEAILNNTIDMLTLSHNSLRQAGQSFQAAFAALGINAPSTIAPYRVRQQDPLAVTDPVDIKWCTMSDISCGAFVSTTGPAQGAGQFTMSQALLQGGEVIAVRKTAPVAGQPQVYDLTFLPASGPVISTTLFADNAISQNDWDFYRRQISITKRTTLYGGFLATVKVWPMIAGADRPADGVSRTIVFTDY